MFQVIIPEDYPNNSLLTCITAWDLDEGRNGQVVYAFNSTTETSVSLPFRVQEDTGCIFVNIDEPFDFETTSRYNLSVTVSYFHFNNSLLIIKTFLFPSIV